MSIDLDALNADLAYAIADLADSIIWKGTSYVCTVGELTQGHTLEMEGYVGDKNMIVVCQTEVFTNGQPQLNDIIEYNSERYRVLERTVHQDGNGITFILSDTMQ